MVQQFEQAPPISGAQPRNGLRFEKLALPAQSALYGLTRRGQTEPDIAPVAVIRLPCQQAALAQSLDQSRKLSLVASAVPHEIALRRTGMACKEAENFAFHMGDVMRTVAQGLVLQGAELVHDRMNEIERALIIGPGYLVDIINYISHDG